MQSCSPRAAERLCRTGHAALHKRENPRIEAASPGLPKLVGLGLTWPAPRRKVRGK
jgi:hypothetical protein